MLPPVPEMIRALVAMPSASSFDPSRDQGNRGVTNLLASWLDELGCSIRIDRLAGAPDRANLIATLGSGDGGLVLSGHSDTVACETTRWKHDPYVVTEDGGRLYGLGIADMKAFFALAIEAMRRAPVGKLRAPLILVATADEECAMAGARMMVAGKHVQARHAILGEPTCSIPVRMHKGMLMESIRIRGRSAHSSEPDTGASAMEGMLRVMQQLTAWRTELQRDHTNPQFAAPFPTLNLGTLHGGDHPNRICGECELQMDLRPLPGMQLREVRSELQRRVHKALEGSELTVEITSLFPGTEPMMTPSDANIVRAAEEFTGLSAGAVAYGTEAPHFASLGIEPLLLGPGDIAQAHQPDEYLRVDRIDPYITLLGQMIERLCMA